MEEQQDSQQSGNDSVAQSKTFDLQQVLEQAKTVLTAPSSFYQQMPRSGGFAHPVIFVAVMGLATGVIAAILSLFAASVGMLALGIAGVIVYPLFAVIGAFIVSAILFVIWKLMGSEQDYEAAFRCWSAATAIYPVAALLSLIPYVGAIVGVLWGTYLMIEASVAVHERPRRTAQMVFGILGLLMLISNVSSEYASRQMVERMSGFGAQFEDHEDMDPEQAGRELGEFLRGLEESTREQQRESSDN